MKPSKIHLETKDGNEMLVELGDKGTIFIDVFTTETDNNQPVYQTELSGSEAQALRRFLNEVL